MRNDSPGMRGVSPAARFWTKVRVTPSCWEWTGARNEWGYGEFTDDGAVWSTHRWAWTHERGPIPDAMYICHHCDNPACVRPSHLFVGSSSDNAIDRERKGRGSKTHYGSGNHHAKLDETKVAEIRRRFLRGETQMALAEEYGVHRNVISNVCQGRTWKHVPMSEDRLGLSKSDLIRKRKAVEWSVKRNHPPIGLDSIPR